MIKYLQIFHINFDYLLHDIILVFVRQLSLYCETVSNINQYSTMDITLRSYQVRFSFMVINYYLLIFSFIISFEASLDASVTLNATGCGFDRHSRKWNIYLNFNFHLFALLSRQSAAFSSSTQHAMRPEFRLAERSFLTLLFVGYSMKLIYFIFIYFLSFVVPGKSVTLSSAINKQCLKNSAERGELTVLIY